MKEKAPYIELAVFGFALSAMVVCAMQMRLGDSGISKFALLAAFFTSWAVFFGGMSFLVRMFRSIGQ
jgi:hypothetical protein